MVFAMIEKMYDLKHLLLLRQPMDEGDKVNKIYYQKNLKFLMSRN